MLGLGKGKGKVLEAGSSSEERRRLTARGTSSSSAYMLSVITDAIVVPSTGYLSKRTIARSVHWNMLLICVKSASCHKCDTMRLSCNISAHVIIHLSTKHTVNAHICLCSQMLPIVDLDGYLMQAAPKGYAGRIYLLLNNLGGGKEWKGTGKVLLPSLQQYRMEDRSDVIRSSIVTGYLVLHAVDERALHLTNTLACTFDQGLLHHLWTTEASAGSETTVLQQPDSLLHKSYKTLCICIRLTTHYEAA